MNTRNKVVTVALAVERWVVVALFLLLALEFLVRETTVVLDRQATTPGVAVVLLPLVLMLPVRAATAAQD